MNIPGANRFLNCVLKRDEKDSVLMILVIMFVAFGTPSYMLYGMIRFQIETQQLYGLGSYFRIVMLMTCVATFVIYFVIKSFSDHHERDVVWMESLTEYARHNGCDTSEMVRLTEELKGLSNPKYVKSTLVTFVVITVICTVSSILYGISTSGETVIMDIEEIIMISFTIVELAAINIFIFTTIRKIDSIQCGFTKLFCEAMSDEEHVLEPMFTGVKYRKLRPHIILMVCTLGVYVFIMTLWTVHTMNLHILGQWKYEENVLDWMVKRDGVESVESITRDNRGIVGLVKRVM